MVFAFWAMVSALLVCLLAYIFFVNTTVGYIVGRKTVSHSYDELTARLADLEARYLVLDGAITREVARGRGFVEPPEIVYVDRGRETDFAYVNP